MPKKKKQEPVEIVRSLHYFGEDGNYGSAEGLTVMETTHWDSIDWDIIEGTAKW